MKSWFSNEKKLIGALSAFAFLSSSALLNAGIIDLLRGEPVDQTLQRVAFVGTAHVKQIQGEVQRLIGVDQWTPLQPGDALNAGDIVRTSSGSVILCMRESESFVKVTRYTLCRLVPIEKGWDPAVISGQEEQEGFVVRGCRGKAYADSGSGTWAPLTVNTVLGPNTQVRTAPGALIDLFHTASQRPLRISGSVEIRLDGQALARRVFSPPSFAARR